MTRPRNERYPDPRPVRNRSGSGQASGGLRDDGMIWLNCSTGQGIVVRLDPQDAERFFEQMLELSRVGKAMRAPRVADPDSTPTVHPDSGPPNT